MITLRVEKTTKNQDDFRVLMFGSLVTLLLLVSGPYIVKVWDTLFASRPFVSATLEIVDRGGIEPRILYDPDALRAADGFWFASMVDESGVQLLTRRGEGSYNSNVDGPEEWTWFAFFDNNRGLNSPGVPTVPFQICVRYIVESRFSGSTDETPTYCSPLYDPT